MQPNPVPTIATPRHSADIGSLAMTEERQLGPVGTKVVFENEQVRVWVLQARAR